MRRSGGATQTPWPRPLGIALLLAATATALPVARWGDSALVLILIPAALAASLAGRRMPSLTAAVVSISAVLAVSLAVSYLWPGGAPIGDWMTGVLIALLTVVAPWWIGRYRLLRAEQRESDAAILAERAQAEERSRIADDLHDTIGHELALIAVQAGALELGRDLTPEQHAQFRALREAAVRASGRLRDVVQMTRPDGPGRLDPSGGTTLDALVSGAREAGMSVDADVDRSVVAEAHPLIAELVVRTVREGLTNAARHAPGAVSRVVVERHGAGHVTVTARTGATTETGTAGGGHGIPSLRRRAELLGGSIDAGRTDDGGFELRLRAPLRPQPAAGAVSRTADAALRSNAQTTRRRVLQTAAVPAIIIALALTGFGVIQALTVAETAISSDAYHAIELGDTRADLETVLPAGIPQPVPIISEPRVPAGAECEYFAARDAWLHFTDATYRLCFEDGVLVEKLLLEAS